MVKTKLTPINNNLHLSIPDSYIGKEIEILIYAKDELVEEKVKSEKSMAYFYGILSDDDYRSLKKHGEQARKEWNRPI